MSLRIELNDRQIHDLLLLANAPELTSVVDKLVQSKQIALSPTDAFKTVHRIAGAKLNDDQIDALIRQILGLRGLMLRRDIDAKFLVEGLSQAIRRDPRLNDAELQASWLRLVEHDFLRLLDSPFFTVTAKASKLAYDFASLLRNARLITDARPVFSDEQSTQPDIVGMVVSHVLRLDCENADQQHSLSIVMDQLDVQKLRDACDRALLKASAIETKMSSVNISTCLVGKSEAPR